MNKELPTSLEEALALGYTLSQVDELRARLKESNNSSVRPQSSRNTRPMPMHNTINQYSIASSSEIDEDEDSTEEINFQSNSAIDDDITEEEEDERIFESSVRLANQQGMLLLMEGDIEGSKVFLDQAAQTLDEITEGHTDNEENSDNILLMLSELNMSESLFYSLRITTLNNHASWWKSNDDPGKALEILGQALNIIEEGHGVFPTECATTCSNLAAVLSQLDRHPLALTYAREAVRHCKTSLFEAKGQEEEGIEETQNHVKQVTGTFAVACHNLAVEIEHVHGVGEALSWYKEALHLAKCAAKLSNDGSKDGICEQLRKALSSAKKKHIRKKKEKQKENIKTMKKGRLETKFKKSSSIDKVLHTSNAKGSQGETEESVESMPMNDFDFGNEFWAPDPNKVELKALRMSVLDKQSNNRTQFDETNGVQDRNKHVRKEGVRNVSEEELKYYEATEHASALLAKEENEIKAKNKAFKLRKVVIAARAIGAASNWSSMARVRSGLGFKSPSRNAKQNTQPIFQNEEEEDEEDEEEEDDVFVSDIPKTSPTRNRQEEHKSDRPLRRRGKHWELASHRVEIPSHPKPLPEVAPAGPPSPFGEPDWNWRAPSPPPQVIKTEHPLLGPAKGVKQAKARRQELWKKERDELGRAAEVQARRSADYWDVAASAAVRRWGKGHHHPGIQPPPGRHKPTGLNKQGNKTWVRDSSPVREGDNQDTFMPTYLSHARRQSKERHGEVHLDQDTIAPVKGVSLLSEPSHRVSDRLLDATRRNIGANGKPIAPKKLKKKKGKRSSSSVEMKESGNAQEELHRAQFALAYESAKVAALSRLYDEELVNEMDSIEVGNEGGDDTYHQQEQEEEEEREEREEDDIQNEEDTQEEEDSEYEDDDFLEDHEDHEDNQAEDLAENREDLVGRSVMKHFEDYGVFSGVVVGVVDGSWEVEYEDGDAEVLGWQELQAILQPLTNNENTQEIETTDADDVDNKHEEPIPEPIPEPIAEPMRETLPEVEAEVAELSIEEMMVMNLQRQIREAMAMDDLDRAAILNEKLQHLEETLLK